MKKNKQLELELQAAKLLLARKSPFEVSEQLSLTLGTVARVLTWIAYPQMATPNFAKGLLEQMLRQA